MIVIHPRRGYYYVQFSVQQLWGNIHIVDAKGDRRAIAISTALLKDATGQGNDADSRRVSELPADWDTRLHVQPSSRGRPDVGTFRDLLFYIKGKPVSKTH